MEVTRQADVIIMCIGISPRLEGEEMDVEITGFHGGDRTTLDLPDLQKNLISEIYAGGSQPLTAKGIPAPGILKAQISVIE